MNNEAYQVAQEHHPNCYWYRVWTIKSPVGFYLRCYYTIPIILNHNNINWSSNLSDYSKCYKDISKCPCGGKLFEDVERNFSMVLGHLDLYLSKSWANHENSINLNHFYEHLASLICQDLRILFLYFSNNFISFFHISIIIISWIRLNK